MGEDIVDILLKATEDIPCGKKVTKEIPIEVYEKSLFHAQDNFNKEMGRE